MTVNNECKREYTTGQAWLTAAGQWVNTRPLSRNPNRQTAHGSHDPLIKFNDEPLFELSSWTPVIKLEKYLINQ